MLVVSTDPAHSLGDALGIGLSRKPRQVRRSLAAVELDAPRAFSRWLAAHRRLLGEILEHGTWLDREDVDALLGLSIPGVDELTAMIAIDRLAAPSRYDLVVVDTAPTGHTLRLLSAPGTVAAVAEVLGALQQEHRLIREQLRARRSSGSGRSPDCDSRGANTPDGRAPARSESDDVRLGNAARSAVGGRNR